MDRSRGLKLELACTLNWRGVLVVGCLGGIGFTMSLFLATLAFDDPNLLAIAKVAILLGSVVAGLGAFVLGRVALFPDRAEVAGPIQLRLQGQRR